jgi:GNAT superfamily N-acetyltransferase
LPKKWPVGNTRGAEQSKMELTTRLIRVKDLLAFIGSEAYRQSEVVPVSPHRALSHTRNPNAQPDDLALVLIYAAGTLQAYLGVLPDLIYPAGKPERAGWLSCMWVSPALRGKGIAKQLINTVFEYWNHRILVTEFTPEAKGLYDRTQQFNDLLQPEGIRGYLRPDFSRLLSSKSEKWARLKPLLSIADALLRPVNRLRLLFYQYHLPPLLYTNEIDAETAAFIETHQQHAFLRRGKAGLDWMLKNPWVLSAPAPDHIAAKYHFTATAKHFAYFAIKICNNAGELTGFLLLSIRDGHLKVPYCYFSQGTTADVLAVIYHHAVSAGANMLTVFHPDLVAAIRADRSSPFFLCRTVKRHYIISKVFSVTAPVSIQDGDADAGFT